MNFSIDDVVKAWGDLSGRIDAYVIQEVPYFEGTVKKLGVALVDKVSGSISAFAAGVADLQEGLNKLHANVGATLVDGLPSTLATPGVTQEQNAERVVNTPAVGIGFGTDVTTHTADGLSDINKQPESSVVTPSAQDNLAGKTVDVSDVTPAAGQSPSDAVQASVPEGATPVVLNQAGSTAEEGNKAVDTAAKNA